MQQKYLYNALNNYAAEIYGTTVVPITIDKLLTNSMVRLLYQNIHC